MTSFSGCAALPLRHKQWGEKAALKGDSFHLFFQKQTEKARMSERKAREKHLGSQAGLYRAPDCF
jgi:hypothetical protein